MLVLTLRTAYFICEWCSYQTNGVTPQSLSPCWCCQFFYSGGEQLYAPQSHFLFNNWALWMSWMSYRQIKPSSHTFLFNSSETLMMDILIKLAIYISLFRVCNTIYCNTVSDNLQLKNQNIFGSSYHSSQRVTVQYCCSWIRLGKSVSKKREMSLLRLSPYWTIVCVWHANSKTGNSGANNVTHLFNLFIFSSD